MIDLAWINILEIAHILTSVQILMNVNLQTPWYGNSQSALQLMCVWRSRIWSQVGITSSELEPATPGASVPPVSPPTWSLYPAVVNAAHTLIRQTVLTVQTYLFKFKHSNNYICLKRQHMMELESSGKTTLNQHLQKSVKLEGKWCCCLQCAW